MCGWIKPLPTSGAADWCSCAATHWLQVTATGAVLDVLADCATRGWMWVAALPRGLGALPVVWEMAVFCFTHKVGCTAPLQRHSQQAM